MRYVKFLSAFVLGGVLLVLGLWVMMPVYAKASAPHFERHDGGGVSTTFPISNSFSPAFPAQQMCGPFADPEDNIYSCGPYGNCTWWAAYRRNGVGTVTWGDAGNWYGNAVLQGFSVCSVAKSPEEGCEIIPGAIAWWSTENKGHVAYIESNNPLSISEMNYYASSPNYPRENPLVWVGRGSHSIIKRDPDGYIYGHRGDPVTLFADPGILGSSLFYASPTNSYHNLSDSFDNQISSVSIQNSTVQNQDRWFVKVYEDKDLGGGCLLLTTDALDLSLYRFNNGHVADNSISSVQVFKNVCPPSCPRLNTKEAFFEDKNGLKGQGICDIPPATNSDNAAFTGNESPLDTATFTPGQSIPKWWEMRNTGTTTWGAGYKWVFVRGERMGASTEINVGTVAPGQVARLQVNLTAPADSGTHWGYWRLRNAQGTYFGKEVWVKVTIPGQATPVAGDVVLSCVDCPAVVSPGQTFRPVLRAKVNSGQLVGTRGDMVRNRDGNRFESYEHVEVVGRVNTGQSYDFVFYAQYPMRAPSEPGTYESKWQVWQNGHYVGNEVAIRFTVSSGSNNRRPNPPTLTGPGDWGAYKGGEPITLTAQQNGDPDGDAVTEYYFDIFESAQNLNSGWITSNSWSPQGLGFYGYQWRVKVRDSRGAESDWSPQVWHFNVDNPAVIITEFYIDKNPRPAWLDGQTGQDKYVICGSATNTTALRFFVNLANDGSDHGEWREVASSIGNNCRTDADRPPTWGQLEYTAGRHLFRMLARGEGGWENAAVKDIVVELSEDRRPDRPATRVYPIYVSPEGHEYINSKTLYLDWVDALRTSSYRLEISTDPNWGMHWVDQQFSAATSEYTYTFDSDYPVVYWRITGTGPYGVNENAWMTYIDITPPASAIEALPAVTTDNQFVVRWGGQDARSGLRWYQLQVRDGNRPDSQWTDWLLNTTKTAEMFQGQPGHTYYFRVRAMDNTTNWEDWPAGDGDAWTRVDPTALPPAPWWNGAYRLKHNLVILNNDTDEMPAGYPVHLHFDGTTSPTAAEIYNGSLAALKGNDVRVIYKNQTELNRVVNQFTSTAIDLWFPLQGGMGGGGTNNGDYQFYYGNAAAGAPLSDVNTVFLPKVDGNTMGLWHFQEGSGGTVYDQSGRGHNGNFTNGSWASGYMGWSGAFNGSNSTVDLGNHADFNNLGAMTLEMWIYPTRGGWGIPLVKGINGYGQFTIRVNGDNNVEFTVGADGGDQTVVSGAKVYPNRWYHIAAVHDGGSNQWIYVNGTQEGYKNNSRTPVMKNYSLYIGNAPWWNGMAFAGQIQHVRISNVARHDFPYARIDTLPTIRVGVPIAPPVQGAPDLIISGVNTFFSSDGGMWVEMRVKNQGNLSTGNDFFTDLYFNSMQPTSKGGETNRVQSWLNAPITSSEDITLTAVITNWPGLDILSPTGELSGTLYPSIDSTHSVSESIETNNVYTAGVEFCVARADAYDLKGRDDTALQATALITEGSQLHNFDHPGDVDWFKFTAVAGKSYRFSTSDLGAAADTVIVLYEGDGTTPVLLSDDYSGTLASQLEWTAPKDGDYYVQVQQWNSSAGGCSTPYLFWFSSGTGTGAGVISTTLYLLPGWNLVSLPLHPVSPTVTQVLGPIAGAYDLVYAYRSCDTADPWKKFSPTAPPYANDLTAVDETMGIWVHATMTTSWILSGTVPVTPAIPSCAGWNLHGYPITATLPVTAAMSSIAGKYTAVYAYYAFDTADFWKKYDPALPPFANDLTTMCSGSGYWIKATEPVTWTLP